MYALKCLVNGEIFKTVFDKSSLPMPITFQGNSAICGAITINPNNIDEINIGGFSVDGGYALADGTLDTTFISEEIGLIARDITIEFLPYETDGDELDGGDKDVYYLISTHILPKSILSCASFDMPPPPPIGMLPMPA